MEIDVAGISLTYSVEQNAWEGVLDTQIGEIDIAVQEVGDPEKEEAVYFQVFVGDAFIHRNSDLQGCLVALTQFLKRMRYRYREKGEIRNGNR